MFKTGKKKKLIIIILSAVLTCMLAVPVFYSVSDELSVTSEVKANILIVEGWLPRYAIRMAAKEFKNKEYDYIVTTGLKTGPDYYEMDSNGSLVYYTDRKQIKDTVYKKHIIGIKAFSSINNDPPPHFYLLVNDSVVKDFHAGIFKRNYEVHWSGSLSDIDSVSVKVVNLPDSDTGEKSLYVNEITIDHKITIPFQNNSVFDVISMTGEKRYSNNFESFAELAKDRLILAGIDRSRIIAVPCRKVRLNRTLTSALAFLDWADKTNINISGINIVSLGSHARRTWMTYNKILDNKYKTGIISLPDFRSRYSAKHRIFKTIRETLGIIYYWIILIPYQ